MKYSIKTGDRAGLFLENVTVADHFWTRFLGLMGRSRIGMEEGLFLKKVSCIHTCFMRFPICAVYLDKDLMVVDMEVIKPWRCGKLCKGAAHVLEIHQEQSKNIRLSAKLLLECSGQEMADGKGGGR
ncbi:DUF192 domain-containing protein [Clostridium sp. AN503]|uniref:DUF192 domain-containing protein n=1 Tax=Clostridium sp. AN503 TaxID=3160598 RepID=UPI00345792D5